MNRFLLTLCAILMVALLIAGDALGHGGSFRGPNGGVPPGLREPSDPEPPPPPPSDPGPGDGPITGEPQPPGTETPGDTGHPDTPGNDSPPPIPTPGAAGNGRGSKTKTALAFSSWRFWWAYNNDDILSLKSHISRRGVITSSPITYTSGADKTNVADPMWPTLREVRSSVIPALERCVNRIGDHEDIHGGALVALGKLGGSRHVPLFVDATWNRYRNPNGQRLDFGGQATESAVLALGLLGDLDTGGRSEMRRALLEAVADDKLRTRERTWAAVGLGLQRDTEAVEPLLALLKQDYADDNVPAGILAGLGLIGDRSVVSELSTMFLTSQIDGRTVSGRVRSFAGYALGKLEDPAALPTILKVLKSRRTGRLTKRSAVIALGCVAPKGTDEQKHEAAQALIKFLRNSKGDSTGEHFALIGLSQIGTDRALNTLLDVMEGGKYSQRPFAALGLATHVFYRDRAAEMQKGVPMDADLRKRIVDRIIRVSRKHKDADTRSAFMLSRGLVQDKTAIEDLVKVVYKKSVDPSLRGFCCVALGLIGDPRDDVKDALRTALAERKSTALRRNAATGLGLLHDPETVDLLLRELAKAKSFAVQGQIITAIGTIGDQRAIAPLINILDDRSQPAQTRAMAAVGLGMIGDQRPLPALSRLSKNFNYRASVPDLNELLYIL